MVAAGESTPGVSGDGQHGADDKSDEAEHPQDPNPGDETEDQQNYPENNHNVPPFW
jgi:hypothetical protein